jgi:phage terminase large subunit-like protein
MRVELRELSDIKPHLNSPRQNGAAVDVVAKSIRQKINELGQWYEIREIAIDRWNATQLATQLEGDGFEVVAFG